VVTLVSPGRPLDGQSTDRVSQEAERGCMQPTGSVSKMHVR
jgi:hypothetical protein